MERYGDDRPVLQLVRPPDGREAHRTGRRPARPFHPILSSVDNGWLAVGLKIVENSVPQLRRRAGALYDAMDFGFYYVPERNRVLLPLSRPDDPTASPCCYDTVVSESRIVDYIGIARGQLPQKEYFGRWRTFPDTLRLGLARRRKPVGVTRTYFGVDVFEGAYPYARHRSVVPSWGGSMFEALMPALFVPGGEVGAAQLGRQPPAHRPARRSYHGLREAGYGYWGFSPANIPRAATASLPVPSVTMRGRR